MAFYAVNVQGRVIQRVTQEYHEVDNRRFFLIEAPSAKQAWAKANRSSAAIGSADAPAAAIVIASFVKNALSQKNILTIGFAIGVRN